MTRNMCPAVLVVSLFAATLGCEKANQPAVSGTENAMLREQPEELVQPAAPQRELHDVTGYTGSVTNTGADWLELGVGWQGSRVDGVKEWNEEDSKKPRRLSAAGTPPGGDHTAKDGIASFCRGPTHLVRDLKVGDVVVVFVGVNRVGDEWVMRLCIRRRPGGRIPHQFGDSFVETEHAIHLRDQAEQDWEEKGIPIPKKYLDPHGRAPWTNPPYPPVASMPRHATAKP